MKADTGLKFEKVYEDESDTIFRFCLIRVSNREQALDIVQETFLRLWQTMSEDKEIRNTRAFLFTVAQRLVIDWYRKKKSFSLDSLLTKEDVEYTLPDKMSQNDIELGVEGRFFLAKINELPETCRDPVYLRFVEGLSPGEIGEILGVSANVVSVRINRGIMELRKKTNPDNTK